MKVDELEKIDVGRVALRADSLEALRAEIVTYVEMYFDRVTRPVAFVVISRRWGKRARRLGVSIRALVLNEPALDVRETTRGALVLFSRRLLNEAFPPDEENRDVLLGNFFRVFDCI